MENVEKRKKKVKQQSFWWFAVDLEADGNTSSHQSDEFLEIDVTVTIGISLSHQVNHFLFGQWFSATHHDVLEDFSWDGAGSFLVEDFEGVSEGLVRVLGWFQGSPDTHEVEVIGEGHVHTILHLGGLSAVGDFGGGGVPSHGVHHSTDFVDVDFFGSGFVVHFEDFGELLDFLWVQFVVGHDCYLWVPIP